MAQQDGYLRYEFIGEKRRIGGNRFELTVHTLPDEGHRNLDIELNVPEITSCVRNKKELRMIEKAQLNLSGFSLINFNSF